MRREEAAAAAVATADVLPPKTTSCFRERFGGFGSFVRLGRMHFNKKVWRTIKNVHRSMFQKRCHDSKNGFCGTFQNVVVHAKE